MNNKKCVQPIEKYITKVYDDIYRIRIKMVNSPLTAVNSYLIKGDDRNILIDTGYNSEETAEIIKESIEYLGLDLADTDILLTHFHDDHAGASTEIIHPSRTIFVPAPEHHFFGIGSSAEYYKECRRCRYRSEGISHEYFEEMMNYRNPGAKGPDFFNNQFKYIEDSENINVGKYTITAVHTPGHTPGHMCYWIQDHKIMFTGDHILFDISSNIIPWPGIPNVLGIYMYSLKKLRSYDVSMTLPGHRESGNIMERIDQQLAHHERRLNECESIVKLYPRKNAFEITQLLSWKIRKKDGSNEIPLSLMRYAYGECLCHLDYLRIQKRIDRELVDGYYVYY